MPKSRSARRRRGERGFRVRCGAGVPLAPGIIAGYWPEYVVTTGAFLWFLAARNLPAGAWLPNSSLSILLTRP